MCFIIINIIIINFDIDSTIVCCRFLQENDDGPHERVTRAAPVIVNGVTDDTPDFDRTMVSLDIPDELFGSSFNTVTNVSKIFGSLIMVCMVDYAETIHCQPFRQPKSYVGRMRLATPSICPSNGATIPFSHVFSSLYMSQNSARRYSQFMQYLKPVLGKALTVKGFNAPPPTTTETNAIDLSDS